MKTTYYLFLILFFLLIRPGIAQNTLNTYTYKVKTRTKVIVLRYSPRETLAPSTDKKFWRVPLNIQDVKDSHSDNLLVVGETKGDEYKYIIKVTSVTSVGSFATKVLKKCYADWGGITGTDTYILEPEILDFFVNEEKLYYTRFKIKFTLKDSNGNQLWSETIKGDAKVFGLSTKEENFNEGFSDVLQEAYVKLFENDRFVNTCLGERESVSVRPVESMDPVKLKEQLLLLINENFDEQAQLAYIRQRPLSSPLSADQMIEWKKAGISQNVIAEVIMHGSSK